MQNKSLKNNNFHTIIILLFALIATAAFILAYIMSRTQKGESVINISQQTGNKQFASYDPDKCVQLADYGEIKADTGVPFTITDKDLNKYSADLISFTPEYTKIDKDTVEKLDVVSISVSESGAAVDGMDIPEETLFYTIGSKTGPKGFDDKAIGKKPGDVITLNLKTNEGDLIYTVSINGIYTSKMYTLDTATEDYLYTNFNARNKDEFLAYNKASLYQMRENVVKGVIENAYEEYANRCTVDIPKDLLEQKYEQERALISAMNGSAKNVEAYAKDMGFNSLEEYYDRVHQQIEKAVRDELICLKLWDELGYEVDDEEFNEYLKEQLSITGMKDIDTMLSRHDTSYEKGEEYFLTRFKVEKMKEYIKNKTTLIWDNNATMTEVLATMSE